MRATRTCIIGSFWRWAPVNANGAKCTQDEPTEAPKIGPRWVNIKPRWPNIGPRGAQHRPQRAQHRAKMGQHGPNLAQHRAKLGQHGRKMGQQQQQQQQQCWPALVGLCPSERVVFEGLCFFYMVLNQLSSISGHTNQLPPTNCHQPPTQTFSLAKLLTRGVIRSYNFFYCVFRALRKRPPAQVKRLVGLKSVIFYDVLRT